MNLQEVDNTRKMATLYCDNSPIQNLQLTSYALAAKVPSSRKSLSTGEVSAFGPNVLHSYISCLPVCRCCFLYITTLS